MKAAVVVGNLIEIIIVVDDIQQASRDLGLILEDAGVKGLQIGDMWDGLNWTRNVEGEKKIVSEIVETEHAAAIRMRDDQIHALVDILTPIYTLLKGNSMIWAIVPTSIKTALGDIFTGEGGD